MSYLTLDEFHNYAKTKVYIAFSVYYNPHTNEIRLGTNKNFVTPLGNKGIFFTKHGKIKGNWIKIGVI